MIKKIKQENRILKSIKENKNIHPGDKVMILRGNYKGETGIVKDVWLDDNQVDVLVNNKMIFPGFDDVMVYESKQYKKQNRILKSIKENYNVDDVYDEVRSQDGSDYDILVSNPFIIDIVEKENGKNFDDEDEAEFYINKKYGSLYNLIKNNSKILNDLGKYYLKESKQYKESYNAFINGLNEKIKYAGKMEEFYVTQPQNKDYEDYWKNYKEYLENFSKNTNLGKVNKDAMLNSNPGEMDAAKWIKSEFMIGLTGSDGYVVTMNTESKQYQKEEIDDEDDIRDRYYELEDIYNSSVEALDVLAHELDMSVIKLKKILRLESKQYQKEEIDDDIKNFLIELINSDLSKEEIINKIIEKGNLSYQEAFDLYRSYFESKQYKKQNRILKSIKESSVNKTFVCNNKGLIEIYYGHEARSADVYDGDKFEAFSDEGSYYLGKLKINGKFYHEPGLSGKKIDSSTPIKEMGIVFMLRKSNITNNEDDFWATFS
jgi:hypothetical protein